VRALILLAAVGWFPGNARAALPDGAFVTALGAGFRVGDRPLVFVGANLELLHGAQAAAQLDETLQAARADGVTVGRVWALGEGPTDAPAWARADTLFRAGPDGWLEAAYQRLDRALAAARARDLRLVVTLANYWGDFGGVPQYLAWAGLPTDGYGATDRFFSDERTRALYRAHLVRLLERVNSVTGVRYVDDPTIFAWELMNESEVHGAEGVRARRAFIEEMAALIRRYDTHHLVTPGVLGYRSRAERAEWLAVCRLPAVDYCDSHLYPQAGDSLGIESDEPAARARAERRLDDFIDDRVQLARHVVGKPVVFGEFGFRTDEPRFWGERRAAWFGRFLERALYDGAAGALVWIYQPWSGRPRDFGIYTDRPATDDVRHAIRVWARRALAVPAPANPRLGAAAGETPLYDPYQTLRRPGRARVVAREGEFTVELAPERFARARWERVGSYDGGALVHAYGAEDGWFEWRFPAPPFRAAHATLVARLSSEFPGTSAPPDGGSHVRVLVDGREVAAADAVPDDGVGTVHRVTFDAASLGAGRHTLRLEVAPGPDAHGLCVYGAATGRAPAPPGETGPLRLIFER
jgi:mannan endo-1,4-beta-mannosidase